GCVRSESRERSEIGARGRDDPPERSSRFRGVEVHLQAISGEIPTGVSLREENGIAANPVERETAGSTRVKIVFGENTVGTATGREHCSGRNLEFPKIARRITEPPPGN